MPAKLKPMPHFLTNSDKDDYLRFFAGRRDVWVFGYGSLMWNPEFPVAESKCGVVKGFHRSFCLVSHHFRGTPERPGLVLGLDEGGECHGLALRIDKHAIMDALDLLWDREMISYAYLPLLHRVDFSDGSVEALMFAIDRDHLQYAGELSDDEVLVQILSARGERGENSEYLFNTAEHLCQLGIEDNHIMNLSKRARSLLL